jgi:alpha-1,6-mannosyl-glycoprotein beta-1,2-N-acetylglucosaminyltransferase
MKRFQPTARSFIKYLISVSLLFTFILNIKFRQQIQQQDNDQIISNFKSTKNSNYTNENLKEIISFYNNLQEEEEVDNGNYSDIILVQVHKRIKYLQKLIESLNNLNLNDKNILVIFSHDFYDIEMNELIKNESKFLHRQIFYPYMLQLYENKFPGLDPNDCPKSIKKHVALRTRCNNADNPDSYGNYREFNIVQIKHHWFWKLAFVFDNYALTKFNRNFGVLLLEEDYYLMNDSLFILDKLKKRFDLENKRDFYSKDK